MHVIIVGAGILGASTAYHLARKGVSVTICERADAGRATSAGAGIVCPWISAVDDPDYYAISSAGARYYPQLVSYLHEDGEDDLAYRRVGLLVVPEDPSLLDAAEQKLLRRRADAPEIGEVRRLTPDQAVEMFPPLAKIRPAVFVEGGARVDGRLISKALVRAAQKHGAVLREGVQEILVSNGRTRGVRTEAGEIEADTVVVAAGAWAPALLRPLGIRLHVEPQRGQIVHLRLGSTDTSRWPVLQPLNSYYLLAFDDSRIVVGATRETGSGFDYRVTAKGQAEVLNIGLSVAPGLANAEVLETRIGFRPMSPDVNPLLGAGGIEGLVIGNGLSHSGLTTGPYSGTLLADVVLGRRPELDLAAYTPLRGQPTLVHT
jgi:D-amino-acid dehydrogenase